MEPEDIDVLYEWENDADVWKVSAQTAPLSRHALKEFIKSQNCDPFETKGMRLVVELRESGRAIGTVDLSDIDIYNRRAGIGILIYAPDDQGKGYAKEAIETMTGYCFEQLSFKQVYCCIAADNVRSIELFKRCGFEIAGLKKAWRKVATGWRDEYFLQKINNID